MTHKTTGIVLHAVSTGVAAVCFIGFGVTHEGWMGSFLLFGGVFHTVMAWYVGYKRGWFDHRAESRGQ